MVARRDLRGEIADLLRYLVPGEQRPAPEGGRSLFDPIGFLTSLADRVVPDLPTPEEAPASPVEVAADEMVPAARAADRDQTRG